MRHSFLSSKSLKIVLTVSLLMVLAIVVEWQELILVFERVDWPLLVPLYILLGSARIVEAYQLKIVINNFRRTTSLVKVILANAIATFYGFILPGELLSTVPKWLILSKDTGSRADILNAILYNRIALLIPPILIGCSILAVTSPIENRSATYIIIASGIGIVIGTFLLFSQRTGDFLLQIIDRIARKFSSRVGLVITTITTSFQRFYELTFRHHLSVYLLSTLVSVIRILGFIFASHIVLIDVPPQSLAFAYTLIVILGLFPLTIGNMGIREGVLIYVLQMFGTTPTQSIILGVILFGEQIIFAIVGGIYQVSLSGKTAPS